MNRKVTKQSDHIGAMSGLGASSPRLRVFIANTPPIEPYASAKACSPVVMGELAHLVSQGSNHWRKLFNVLAKLQFELSQRQAGWSEQNHSSWQTLRDQELLQKPGQLQLWFGGLKPATQAIDLVCGKQFAQAQSLALEWQCAHFARSPDRRLLVSPYPDYRQLTNARIEQLAHRIAAL